MTASISSSALAESGFEPLARTCQFMLTEEAHHMFVGDTGLSRVVKRTAQLMKQNPNEEVRAARVAFRSKSFRSTSTSGSVIRSICLAAKSVQLSGLLCGRIEGHGSKSRSSTTDHIAAEGVFTLMVVENGKLAPREVPLRNALNEVLRGEYVEDCEKGLARWNKALADEGVISASTCQTFAFIDTWANTQVIVSISKAI